MSASSSSSAGAYLGVASSSAAAACLVHPRVVATSPQSAANQAMQAFRDEEGHKVVRQLFTRNVLFHYHSTVGGIDVTVKTEGFANAMTAISRHYQSTVFDTVSETHSSTVRPSGESRPVRGQTLALIDPSLRGRARVNTNPNEARITTCYWVHVNGRAGHPGKRFWACDEYYVERDRDSGHYKISSVNITHSERPLA